MILPKHQHLFPYTAPLETAYTSPKTITIIHLAVAYDNSTGQVNTLTKLLKNEKTPFFRNLVLLPLLVQQETDPDIQVRPLFDGFHFSPYLSVISCINILRRTLFMITPWLRYMYMYVPSAYNIETFLFFSGRKQLMGEYKHLTTKWVGNNAVTSLLKRSDLSSSNKLDTC